MATNSVFALADTSTFRDDGSFGLTGRPIVGVRVVLEWCARAVYTRRGSMRWARDKGASLRDLENGDFSITELEQARAALDAEIRGVDFVLGVSSRLLLDAATRITTFSAGVTIAEAGTYPLAVSIDQAGAALAAFGGTT